MSYTVLPPVPFVRDTAITGRYNHVRMLRLLDRIWTQAIELGESVFPELKGRTDGVFTFASQHCLDDSIVTYQREFSLSPLTETKREKYGLISLEKLARLAERNSDVQHVTSWESRNPKSYLVGQPADVDPYGKWGGAICCTERLATRFFFSFSGSREKWDEVFMVVLARKMGLIDESSPVYIQVHSRSKAELEALLRVCFNIQI